MIPKCPNCHICNLVHRKGRAKGKAIQFYDGNGDVDENTWEDDDAGFIFGSTLYCSQCGKIRRDLTIQDQVKVVPKEVE